VRAVLALVALCCAPAMVSAHDVSRSESRLVVEGREIQCRVTLDLAEFPGVDVNRDATVSYEELDPAFDRIYASLKAHFVVESSGPPLRIRMERYELLEDHLLRIHLRYAFAAPPARVAVTSTLNAITRPDHRHLISVRFDDEVQESVVGVPPETVVFERSAAHPYLRTVQKFVILGVEHIATGWDHLAFLACLLIASTKFRSLVQVITSFTIAHSITLALSTFDIVVVPTRLTESLIALSIAYVALENLLQFRAIERYKITFLFGLVHGFGFSNVLRDMQLPRPSLALSLFSFNVGVEIGQIAFVAAVFPLVFFLSSRRWFVLRPVVSLSVVCLAVYWFVQRAFIG
jgi:hypothetical protein